eukprot:scaffold127132_cov63-Phaeocystis_antarctica.AAC.3
MRGHFGDEDAERIAPLRGGGGRTRVSVKEHVVPACHVCAEHEIGSSTSWGEPLGGRGSRGERVVARTVPSGGRDPPHQWRNRWCRLPDTRGPPPALGAPIEGW